MTKPERIKFLLANTNTQINNHSDISGVGAVRKMTLTEIKRAYKRIGKPLPERYNKKTVMKIINKEAV